MREIARLTRTVFLEYDLVYALESICTAAFKILFKMKFQIARARIKHQSKRNANSRDAKKDGESNFSKIDHYF